MSARDDFEIIKETCLNVEGGAYSNHVVTAAFNNLFTVRLLTECFKQGYRHCWAWNPDRAEIKPVYFDMRSNELADFCGVYLKYLAIPIMTPEDMGA